MRLWIIQLGAPFVPLRIPGGSQNPPFLVIIMAMIQILAFPLGKIKQPRVISEVIAGIILGPTGLFRLSRLPNL